MNGIRVVLADDQPLVRAGLRMILETEADIEIVGAAATGAEVVGICERQQPDVVLMDVRMPEMDGIEATRLVTAAADPPRVLVLTTFDLDEIVYDALRAGASGFLLKDTDPAVLVRAVRDLAAGGAVLDPGVAARVLSTVADGERAAEPARRLLSSLSEREREVVGLIGQGLSNAEIGSALHLSEATVKGYVSAVLGKIGAVNRVQAALVAYRGGLIA
jgi:DNA-binding NarL/FixJ family response regulator